MNVAAEGDGSPRRRRPAGWLSAGQLPRMGAMNLPLGPGAQAGVDLVEALAPTWGSARVGAG